MLGKEFPCRHCPAGNANVPQLPFQRVHPSEWARIANGCLICHQGRTLTYQIAASQRQDCSIQRGLPSCLAHVPFAPRAPLRSLGEARTAR
eukprot:6173443-Pleurochrysis_carterae.AAC.2